MSGCMSGCSGCSRDQAQEGAEPERRDDGGGAAIHPAQVGRRDGGAEEADARAAQEPPEGRARKTPATMIEAEP
jgi:hypothetical protein